MHTFLLAALLAFPVPQTPRIPISAPQFGAAPGNQLSPLIASNGTIALAVWQDQRASQNGSSSGFAARIAVDGSVLDPLGIALGSGIPLAVAWDGNEFVVVESDAFLSVSIEGTILERNAVSVQALARFGAVTSEGPLRVLFLAPDGARIYGPHGDLVAVSGIGQPNAAIAGSRNSELLIVRWALDDPFNPGGSGHTVADRLDANGRHLGTVDTLLPHRVDEFDAVGGGPDGWLLVSQFWNDPAVVAYRLDANGVAVSAPITLLPADPNDRKMYSSYKPRVVREANGYLVAWHRSLQTGESAAYVAEVADNGAPAVKALSKWGGITSGAAIAAGLAVFSVARLDTASSYDIVAQAIDGGPPRVVTSSATLQSDAAAAAGVNGYLVAWRETGPDGFSRLYARRFPDNDAPTELRRTAVDPFYPHVLPTAPRVVSNGETYLVTWAESSTLFGRRLSARNGEWLDAEPFTLQASAEYTSGTNGRDALLAWHGACAGGVQTCLHTRHIALSGDPLASSAVSTTLNAFVYDVTIGSNGDDYLIAWSDGMRACMFLCAIPPFRILGVRARADGTRLDASPLVIEDAKTYAQRPSIAWNGRRYVVAWTDLFNAYGRYVTAEGALPEPTAIVEKTNVSDVEAKVLTYNGRTLLLTRRASAWSGVAFAADTPLDEVAALPRSFVSDQRALAAAPRGNAMLIATDALGDASLGFVPRVVLQIFGDPVRR
ncbi:MAG TPA: hypothetical protein VEO74_14840, partial [Thermoanaerobaculia bacterium]|nr:hypothetical protein [Thermoanaerobaculia bacterium]